MRPILPYANRRRNPPRAPQRRFFFDREKDLNERIGSPPSPSSAVPVGRRKVVCRLSRGCSLDERIVVEIRRGRKKREEMNKPLEGEDRVSFIILAGVRTLCCSAAMTFRFVPLRLVSSRLVASRTQGCKAEEEGIRVETAGHTHLHIKN